MLAHHHGGDLAGRLITTYPGEGQQRVVGSTFDHPPGKLGLGREHHARADTGAGEPGGLVEPGRGQVQLSVDQHSLPARDGVGREHPDLTVGDLPRGAGVLPLHPGRAATLLLKPGVVDYQDPVSAAEPLGHLRPQRVPDLISIPAGMAEQPLHPIRCAVPGILGQQPAVLPLQTAQQPIQTRPRPQPGLAPDEERCQHLRKQLIQRIVPPRGDTLGYRGRHGHRLVIDLHTSMVTAVAASCPSLRQPPGLKCGWSTRDSPPQLPGWRRLTTPCGCAYPPPASS
ncbi:hypothetical protein Nocox_21520 [Nonomuraea coxensis DSM 45129]|uniref:Uncharacterized protein n=1 Tax=Nonomuraea coxensis DSM 45129 TaxID=1122611 RepID=A0ABX8U5H7_9ACTN|nr:hypothetical protein Nocox_21520 [Nonomuraea coxensis DSM 45129]